MKMSYVLKSRNKSGTGFLKKLFISLCIFIIISLILLFSPSFFAGTLITASAPLWKASNIIKTDTATNVGFFGSKMALVEENLALKAVLEDMRLKEIAYDALKEEYDSFKNSFGSLKPEGYILAGVLVRPPQAPYDNLIVDSGSENGVRVGDLVFANNTIILGEVVEVYENKAKVELYSTSGKKNSGFISRTETSVDIEGRGGGDFEVAVPRDVVINESDVFVTSGISGYVIASVKFIDSKPTEAFQRVLSQSPANISQIRWVAIRRQ